MAREYETVFRLGAELEAKFGATFAQANAKVAELDRKLKALDDRGSKGKPFGKGIADGIMRIGKIASTTAITAAGAAAAGGIFAAGAVISNSLEKSMNFESQMSTIKALTGATADEMSRMQSLALKMGADTKYSALEAAQGIEELLKAGISPAAVEAGGLQAALNLATAGGLDLAAAAEIMSTSLNAYKRDGMSAAQASDILAGTANASATSVEELRYSLAMVSAVAAGFGQNFEDTNVALGLFANNGLKGSDAGTSLKTMLMNLSNAFFDAKGNIQDLGKIAGVLQKKLKGLTREQRLATLEQMFGSDAIRAANILFEEGAEGVEKFRKEMSKVTALDVAKQKMDNAAGAVEQFKGALETLQISALMPILPYIKQLANAAADFVTKYTPQITAGIQRMVETSKKYLQDHFINNPAFTKLKTFESKVDFIFTDVMKTFNQWWASSGKDSFKGITEEVVRVMSNTLSASTGPIADAGLKIGAAMADGMWQGLKNSKVGKWIEFLTPDWWEGILSGDYEGAFLDAISMNSLGKGRNGPKYTPPDTPLEWDPMKRGSKPQPKPFPGLQQYARGGFSSRAAIFGEDGLEAAIPINNKPRSHALLERTNRLMGRNFSGTTFVYSPTIRIEGNADQAVIDAAVRRGNEDFRAQATAFLAHQRRVSMI